MPDDKTLRFRYPGTKPFEADEAPLFKGRDNDVENLTELMTLQNLVVLFGRSGLGKSSLLNAGLFNRLHVQPGTTPLFVRFGAYYDKNTASPLAKLSSALASEGQMADAENFIYQKLIPKEAVAPHNLWYVVKSGQLARPQQQSVVLIFDQFEELFTYPEADIATFKKELSELLFVSVPQQLRNLLKEKLRINADYLTEEERETLFRPLNVKALFSIRSDKLSLLNGFTDFFPSVLNTCYELKPLSREQARQAIEEPARLPDDRYASPPFAFTGEAVTLLLNALTEAKRSKDGATTGHAPEIETFQLQIVCRHAENTVLEKGLRQIAASDLGDIKAIFENHYRNIIDKFPAAERLPAQRLIEEKLIIDGNRVSMPIPFILRDEGMTPELLGELINTHLLRREQNNTVEISHDTLVEPILKQYEERRKKEAVARELREKEAQISILKENQEREAQQQKAKRNKLLVSIVSVALMLMIGLAGYALRNSSIANQQKILADEQRHIAVAKSEEALLERAKAITNARQADSARHEAEKQKHIADSSASLLADALAEANHQKQLALLESEKAKKYAEEADNARKITLMQSHKIRDIMEAFRLTVLSYEWIDKDATVALRIQEAAMQKYNDPMIVKVAEKIFDKHGFYRTLVKELPEIPASLSTDGKMFATRSGIWNIDGTKKWSFTKKNADTRVVAFTPDRKKIVTGSDRGIVRLWSTDSDSLKEFSGGQKLVYRLAISPDGTRVFGSHPYEKSVVWSDDSKVLWEKSWNETGHFSFGTFSPSGNDLLTGPHNDTAYLWSIKPDTLKAFFTGMRQSKLAIFSPDGKLILTDEGLWNAGTNRQVWKFDHDQAGYIDHLSFSSNGERIVSSSGDEVHVWRTRNGSLLHKFASPKEITSVAFASDGKSILTTSADSTIKSWDVFDELGQSFAIEKKDKPFTATAFSTVGSNLLTCSEDTILKRWDSTGRLERQFPVQKDSITALALSQNSDAVFVVYSTGLGRLWNKDGTFGKQWKVEEKENTVTAVAFSANGLSIVTAANNGSIKQWARDGSLQKDFKTFANQYHSPNSIALSFDEKNLLLGFKSSSYRMPDREVILWNLDINEAKNLGNGSSVAFSADGKKIIIGSRVPEGISEYTIDGILLNRVQPNFRVHAVSFSKDGTKLFAVSEQGEIQVWDSSMPLQEYLQSDKIDKLTPEQKQKFGIK